MDRVKLDLPDKFLFSTNLKIRITDIIYGGHLGNDSILSLIHEARVRFLEHYGFSEKNIAGPGIIMVDSVIVYKSESFYGEELTVDVTISKPDKHGCDFLYKLSNKSNDKEVARSKTGIRFYDYENKKIVNMPSAFEDIFKS